MFALRRSAADRSRYRPRLEVLETRIQPAVVLPDNFRMTSWAGGLTAPTAMEFAPDGRLFVAEKDGDLRIINTSGTLLATPFLHVNVDTNSERGLIGVTLDPNFATNHFVYIYYTTSGADIHNRVSRFKESTTTPNRFDATFGTNGEQILLDNIPSLAGNHNGGALHFSPDGTLFIGVGDSGSTPQNAPNLASLSGKILRINADGTIPTDNPFFNTDGARKEIWARGFRNPFTFNFSSTGLLYVNDVGQNSFEEVDNVAQGLNYGWPQAEGFSNTAGLVNPIYAYPHNGQSAAITGGVFYEANQFPARYQGSYFFSDFILGFIRGLDPAHGNKVFAFARNVPGPVDLDVGSDGRLYVLSITNGVVFRISDTASPLVVVSSQVNNRPLIRVLDGGNQTERFHFFPYDASFTGAVRVAVGDVNGDGFSDIITAPNSGPTIIRAFNGFSGTLLPGAMGEFRPFSADGRTGAYVASGDFNADGKADIVVGRGSISHWQVKVFRGTDHALMTQFDPYGSTFSGGVRVAVGDFNQDTKPDIITAPGRGPDPLVRVFSGDFSTSPPAMLTEFLAYESGFQGGVFVAAGDIDGDGKADIVTGPGAGRNPDVKVFLAANLSSPSTFLAYDVSYQGGVRVAVGRLFGDGTPDVLTAPGPGHAPTMKIFDGDTLGPLPDDTFAAFGSGATTGVFAAVKR